MTPDTLASILDANPYPGGTAAHFASAGAVCIDFDGLILTYKADGWHVEALHFESLLNEYSAPEAVAAEIRRILKTVFTIKVGAALSDAEALGSVDPVEYLTDLAAEKMLSILDVAALANARQAKIASNVAEAAARDMRIADLERDLANKTTSLKTTHAALTRICEVIGAPAHVSPDVLVTLTQNALNEVKMQVAGLELERSWAGESAAEIFAALNDAGAPRHYLDDDGQESAEVPAAERVRILAEIARSERVLREQTERNAAVSRDHLSAVALTLDDAGAPRQAGSVTLSPAARIRTIVR